ncbi:MAG: SDR family NAD(P)-dependent oxidoreductase [Pseudomonadota bacterium]|nr:SDR family NAD(P)-dependent oxidoreductase [Pseudomonadota bacterium]
MSKLCEGRVAIVTGAGRGVGREYAKLLAAQGAKVVVNDLGTSASGTGEDTTLAQQVVDEIKAAGGEAVANYSDVSDWAAAKALVDQAITTFGKLDVLINNAGILRDRMFVNMTEAEWDAVVKVNLKGTAAPTHHACVYWRNKSKESGEKIDGRVINTSSASGIYGNVGQCNYSAAKGGIASFTTTLALEMGRYGVTVNAIGPRAETRLTTGLRELTAEQLATRSPHWVAPIVVWLASTESSAVSGRFFEAGSGMLAIAEGWHQGPRVDQVDDPTLLGPIVGEMMARARPNADINGQDIKPS